MKHSINVNFNRWLESFSGCDGGNLQQASIWFCGIEWGLSKKALQNLYANNWKLTEKEKNDHKLLIKKYYEKVLVPEIDSCNERKDFPTPEYKADYIIKDNLYYQYGTKLARLYAAIKGKTIDSLTDEDNKEIFKMNLYPIPFHEDDDSLWIDNGLDKLTGCGTKQIYRTICHFQRFKFIHTQVKKHNPEVIIATGLSYLTDYILCFAGKDGTKNIYKEEIEPKSPKNGAPRAFYWASINENNTILVVTPFFGGPSGINSYFLADELGKRIKQDILEKAKNNASQ